MFFMFFISFYYAFKKPLRGLNRSSPLLLLHNQVQKRPGGCRQGAAPVGHDAHIPPGKLFLKAEAEHLSPLQRFRGKPLRYAADS